MSTYVTYTWEPPPGLLADSFYTVAEELERTEIPLAYAAEQTEADIRERFLTETDPEGRPWEPWSDKYAPTAISYPNDGILRRDGYLYEAAVYESKMVVSHDTLFYETTMPEYGEWHQEGRPDRRTKGGAPNPLPQRRFLGLSEQARVSIFVAFGEWFDQAIALYPTATGRIGRRHSMRGAGGTFIPRSTPMPARVG